MRVAVHVHFTCPLAASSLNLTEGEWSVLVVTSDVANAGTRAQVSVVVYGDKGQSDVIALTSGDSAAFEQGKQSSFTVSSSRDLVDCPQASVHCLPACLM